MTRNRRPRKTRRQRPPPGDPFEQWLALVDLLLIEPLIDVGREVRKLLRRHRR